MKTRCPDCNQKYEVSDDLIDQQVECQNCNRSFIIGRTPIFADKKTPPPPSPPLAPCRTMAGKSNQRHDPAIVQIIEAIGIFGMVAIVVIIIVAISMFATGEDEKAIVVVCYALYVFAATILTFALASIIAYLARIEYNTRREQRQ